MGRDNGMIITLPLAGGLELEASGIIRDRGAIRCVLTVRRAGELLFRDQANLTGDRSRQRLLRRLSEEAPGALDGAALLALEEAIRRATRAPENKNDTPLPDTSEKVLTLAELQEVVTRWLAGLDPDALPVVLAAVAGHRLGGESPWLLVVGPPSSAKTELLRMLWALEDVFPLSELTARTFASGLEKEKDPSLLKRLKEEILVLKDLTTVLELHREERQAILAQLREIYDGRFDKAWGTGKELHWEGRLGFIAGVTPVIDHYYSVMALLGPRFLQLRLSPPPRQEAAERAVGNAGQEEVMRKELQAACRGFFAQVPRTPPEVPGPVRRWLAGAADLVTRARSPVIRDGFRREVEYVPEPEVPARLARQLYALLQGLTLVAGRPEPGPEELRRTARVALDCVPAVRRRVLAALAAAPSWLTTTQVANQVQQARTTVVRALEDLQALGLVLCDKTGTGVADRWALTEEARDLIRNVGDGVI